ncbi:MAG: hypothetical protein H6511_01635 [Holophagales bacterium]|nr:hypothetical protein [Holophagales bacterium]
MRVFATRLLPVVLLGALASPALAGNAPSELASVAPTPESVVLGSIESLAVDRCILSLSVQVTADAGGGTDDFRVEVYDDGQLIRTVPLSVPADGAVHQVSASVGLPVIGQQIPGIGVYLVDDQVLDVEDPFDAACVLTEVPTLGSAGLAGLGALLGVAALVAFRRRARVA